MKERIGKHYRLFTMKINGIRYYLIGNRNEKSFCFLSDKSEQAVKMFELLERSNSVKEK